MQKEERRKAPQAAVHARGGRWEVPANQKTGTHWDESHHVDLRRAAEEAGLYKKDMSKIEMIHVLANKDRIDEFERSAAEREERRKRKVAQAREKKTMIEKVRKKQDRERRRKDNEGYVSDTTEEEPEGFNVETDAESISTATTATTQSIAPIYPAQRLRIYEWPYGGPPSLDPPRSPISPTIQLPVVDVPELLPKKLPYAVMKLVTTYSEENVELPGRQYSEEVGPDFVLSLSEHTKDCARNGILYGQLQRAIIERGADWADRTQVQWWNGRMYFHLPPRSTSKKALADVYAKWRKKKKFDRFTQKKSRGVISKSEPKRKVVQRLKDQRQKMLDVYAVSEHRPPICYMPSYLDYPLFEDDQEVEKSIENLYYIRFLEMDLPHYYFWSTTGQWEDPTEPNPEWLETEVELAREEHNGQERLHSQAHTTRCIVTDASFAPAHLRKMLVKRTAVPHKFRHLVTLPKTSEYKFALWAFEKDLYYKGWAHVLNEARERWIENGKTTEWSRLISNLPMLYPAGNLPISPPVNPPSNISSLAEKFAAIEVPSDQRLIQAIVGDEPWTRDDTAYWLVVNVPDIMETDIQDELLRSMNSPALERRSSEVTSWINAISTSPHSPSDPPFRDPSTPSTNTANQCRLELKSWEDLFISNFEGDKVLCTCIEQTPIAELKEYDYDTITLRKDTQSRRSYGDEVVVCLLCDGTIDPHQARAHLGIYDRDANDICPFCGIPWNKWQSDVKASHIFNHSAQAGEKSTADMSWAGNIYHHRSSAASSGVKPLYSVPQTKRRTSSWRRNLEGGENLASMKKRRISKVSFSPVTVEKRVAYNDFEEEDEKEADADVRFMGTALSPRPSNSRKNGVCSSPKSVLKIDTGVGAAKSARSWRPHSTVTTEPFDNNIDEDEEDTPNETLRTPSSSTTRIKSQSLRVAEKRRRLFGTHVDNSRDPRRITASVIEHKPNPPLHQFGKYLNGQPKAAWDPRKASQSSFENLEFDSEKRELRKATGKGKAKAVKEEDDGVIPLKRESSNAIVRTRRITKTMEVERKGKRKVDKIDELYEDAPQSTSSSEYIPIKIPKKRRKIQDPTYQDHLPSSPSSSSQSPALVKRRKPADPTFRYRPEPSSPSTASERRVKKRRRAKRGKATVPRVQIGETPRVLQQLAPTSLEDTHHASTTSVASSRADRKRSSAVSWENSTLVVTSPKKRRMRAKHDACCVLQRRSSVASPGPSLNLTRRRASTVPTLSLGCMHAYDGGNDDEADGFLACTDSLMLEDNTSDVLTGKPFAPPLKKGKAIVKPGPPEKYKTKSKPTTSKAVALDFKRNTKGAGLASRRIAIQKKKAVLSRSHVGPLVPALARYWLRSRGNRIERDGEPSTASTTVGLLDFLDPPTSNSKMGERPKMARTKTLATTSKGDDDNLGAECVAGGNGRGRRSAAPTPSPSLIGHRGSVYTIDLISRKVNGKGKGILTGEATKKRALYDVSNSDTRSCVPSNTPVDGLPKKDRADSRPPPMMN